MLQVVLATTNRGKVKDFQELSLEAPWLELAPAPEGFDVEETGSTFLENAILKAIAAATLTGKLVIADDSGLTVEALNGGPGIYSARYCEGTDADRRAKLLKEMVAVPKEKRHAAFVCAMALADGQGTVLYQTQELWPGSIALTEAGKNGFGYDSLFVAANTCMTAAQLSHEQKNKISHRAQAWSKVLEYLKCMYKANAEA
jgi:XTP/dITP diphosphohydrolase